MTASDSTNTHNPYQAPVVAELADAPAFEDSKSLLSIARTTFLAWEKLRLVFIGMLAVVTLLTACFDPMNVFGNLRFWLIVIEGAVIANVCYFAGPVIETYVTWLGVRATWLRMAMFVLGTFFSAFLALVAVASMFLPNMT